MTPKNAERIKELEQWSKGCKSYYSVHVRKVIEYLKEADANAEEDYLPKISELQTQLLTERADNRNKVAIEWVKETINDLNEIMLTENWTPEQLLSIQSVFVELLKILDAKTQEEKKCIN